MIILQLATQLIGLITSLFIIRSLSISDLGVYQLLLSLTAVLSFSFNGVRSDFIRFKFIHPFKTNFQFYLPNSNTQLLACIIINIIIGISVLAIYNFSFYLLVVLHGLLFSIYLMFFSHLSITDRNHIKLMIPGLLSLIFLIMCVSVTTFKVEEVILARCTAIILILGILYYLVFKNPFLNEIKAPVVSYNTFYKDNYINNFGSILENQSDKVLIGYASSILLGQWFLVFFIINFLQNFITSIIDSVILYTWNKDLNNRIVPVRQYQKLLLDILLIYLLSSYLLYFFGAYIFTILDKEFNHTNIMIALCCSYLIIEFLIVRRVLISTDNGKYISYVTCIFLILSVLIFTSGANLLWLLLGFMFNCFLRLWIISIFSSRCKSMTITWPRDILYFKYGIFLVFLPLVVQVDQRFQYILVGLSLGILYYFSMLICKHGLRNGIFTRYYSVH